MTKMKLNPTHLPGDWEEENLTTKANRFLEPSACDCGALAPAHGRALPELRKALSLSWDLMHLQKSRGLAVKSACS